jgi:predicted nucleotidyltransferase
MVDSAGQTGQMSREQAACSRAAAVLKALQTRGVDAVVTGSLAARNFGPGSDVDFLVRACPEHLRYALEAAVEDIMLDIPFDLVYRDELPVRVAERMAATVATAEDLIAAARG